MLRLSNLAPVRACIPNHAQEPLWLDGGLEFPDDPLLETAYTVSKWAITYVGPIFWMCLAYLFLVAQLGR